MEPDSTIFEIRAARCSIDDKAGTLRALQETARCFNTHITCFNADLLAGRRHAESAMRHAIRACIAGETISNTLEMEALLYAAGSRQCNVAASFGIHEGENNLWICCYPSCDGVWDALSPVMQLQDGSSWDAMDRRKQERLMQVFGITKEEQDSLDGADRFADLVLERVALLEVIR
ncbi:MAG: KEOPS complex subunit Cgi121 [Methanoregula sp.]